MSLQTRLADLITAVGADIKSLRTRVTTLETAAPVAIDPWRIVGAGGEPAFAGGWINYGSGYPVAAFKKYPDGRVRLQGLVKNGTNGQPIFTLPVGYRPLSPGDAQLIFSTVAVSAFGEIRIGSDGLVVVQAGANGFVSLDGIEFDTGKTTWPSGPKGDPGPAGTTGAIIPVVTALPSSPYDGQEIYFQNSTMAASGIFWHLRYDASLSWTFRWVFLGGGALYADGSKRSWNDRSTPNNTANQYLDPTAPQIRIPLAGTYDVEGSVVGVTNNTIAAPGFFLGRTTSTDANWPGGEAVTSVGAGGVNTYPMSGRNRIDYSANDLAAMWYTNANVGGAVSFYNARMIIRPHRVGAPSFV